MALKPGEALLNGQVRILRQLGHGGFGFVYLAEDTLLGEEVAIKELIPALAGDETVLKRFLAEAKATMRLTHERIVRTYNVFSEGGNYYIAMEFMAGGSLEDRLQHQGIVPVDEAVQVSAQVCEALCYAHQRGVVHCDLKPANILFAADGSTKVADFGIAHVSEQLLARTWRTSVGYVAGTLPFMSPEQADGVRNDPRIDVYALGAVLYQMLTGRSYLEFDRRETPGAQADNVLRIRTGQIAPPSAHNRKAPPWLDTVVLKALAKQADERYASADDLRAVLLAGEDAVVVTQAAPPTPRLAPEQSRRRRMPRSRRFWLLLGGGAVLSLAIIVTIALILGGGQGRKAASVITAVITSQPMPAASFTVEPPTTDVAPPTQPTATLLPAPTQPLATPTAYSYGDDFGNPDSGWDVYDDGDTAAGYQDGEYRLAVSRAQYVTWGDPNLAQEVTDLAIDVDARQMAGPVDNNFGLLVRYRSAEESFYWFQISGDGYYAVDMLQQGEFVPLVTWEPSAAINQGVGATNHLKVICTGGSFSFYVNDIFLVELTEDTLRSGSFGLAVGTFDESGVVVHFDNLRVRGMENTPGGN
jgi:serine/threonine protein kinase